MFPLEMSNRCWEKNFSELEVASVLIRLVPTVTICVESLFSRAEVLCAERFFGR
jgi:hypothetical protein